MTKQNIKDIVNNKNIYVFDSQSMPYEDQGVTHFALVDSLMNEVGRSNNIILHFWPTKKLVFLGMQDTRLPHLDQALSVIEDHDYDYVVRNSGGLAVVSDEGILNMSLIIPNDEDQNISIDEGYQIMYSLMKDTIDAPVDAVEIPDSYCPGDFDLSIRGQKISGISQRRRAGSLSIMLYLSIEGDQNKRSNMMKDFYERGLQGEDSHWNYPAINPDVMVNLDEAIGQSITVTDVKTTILDQLESYGAHILEGDYTNSIQEDFDHELEQMIKRNQRMLGNNFKQ